MSATAETVHKLETALYNLQPVVGWELVREDDWLQYTQFDAPTHYRNGVLRSVLAEGEADARIERTIEHYREHDLPFRWVVTPTTRPRDTATRLAAHGLQHFETLEAMVARPVDFPPPMRGDVEIVEVDESKVEEYVAVSKDGWGLVPPAVVRFRESLLRHLAKEPRDSVYLVARLDGVPAATGSFSLIEDFAHFSGAATNPAYRRRGLYRELILARMAILRERGVTLATNHCVSTSSAPICARLGFERICDFEVYTWEPACGSEESA